MRTYLVDEDNNELIVDLRKTIIHNRNLVEFELSTLKDNEFVNIERIFIRNLAGDLFSSTDGKRWRKMAKQTLPKQILNVNRVFNVHRGFKPSGAAGGGEGDLFTKMPGKVIKIMVSQGDRVKKGQKMLILEAMKMENEIKSSATGTVKTIHVKEGDTLDTGVLMMEIE